MSEIALYNILKRIEGVSDDEIEKAHVAIEYHNAEAKATVEEARLALKKVEDLFEKVKEASDRGWATSLDLVNLKIELIDRIAEQERRLIKHIYGAFGMALVGVGLMIKFL